MQSHNPGSSHINADDVFDDHQFVNPYSIAPAICKRCIELIAEKPLPRIRVLTLDLDRQVSSIIDLWRIEDALIESRIADRDLCNPTPNGRERIVDLSVRIV